MRQIFIRVKLKTRMKLKAMKYLRLLIILIYIICTSSYAFSQYSYSMFEYAIEMKNGAHINAYSDYQYTNEDKPDKNLLLILQNKRDTIEAFISHYSYSYFSIIDSAIVKRSFYWNRKTISLNDMKSVIFQREIAESTLMPASFDKIPDNDTIWMNSPVLDSYRIGIFDSIVSNEYICGCNYEFYAHSNSKETTSFMSEVRALDKALLEYAIKEYDFELDDEKIEYMQNQVNKLITKMGKLKIVLILDCFD